MEAFEEIYRASSGYVYTVAYGITASREDAEEVTQDVFVKIYRKLGGFGFRSSFKTWIYRITANTAINRYRKKAKRFRRERPLDEVLSRVIPGEKGDEKFDADHNRTLVDSMLKSLPPDQRACVVLREIEGLKYEEIARTLEIKINTVKTRLKRARKKLMTIYGKGEKP